MVWWDLLGLQVYVPTAFFSFEMLMGGTEIELDESSAVVCCDCGCGIGVVVLV